jgi:hypothetical protein
VTTCSSRWTNQYSGTSTRAQKAFLNQDRGPQAVTGAFQQADASRNFGNRPHGRADLLKMPLWRSVKVSRSTSAVRPTPVRRIELPRTYLRGPQLVRAAHVSWTSASAAGPACSPSAKVSRRRRSNLGFPPCGALPRHPNLLGPEKEGGHLLVHLLASSMKTSAAPSRTRSRSGDGPSQGAGVGDGHQTVVGAVITRVGASMSRTLPEASKLAPAPACRR